MRSFSKGETSGAGDVRALIYVKNFFHFANQVGRYYMDRSQGPDDNFLRASSLWT